MPVARDVWWEPREKWFLFKIKSEERDRQQKLDKLKSSMVDIPQIMEQFKEYDRLQKKKTRREKQKQSIILMADKEYALAQMRPSNLKGKQLKNANQELQKVKNVMVDKEITWRGKLLPRDRNYALCKEVIYEGFTFGFQCIFCGDLFTHYPLHHTRFCFANYRHLKLLFNSIFMRGGIISNAL